MQIEDVVLALLNENQKDIEISYDEFTNLEFVPYAAYDVSFKHVKDVTDRVKVLKLKDDKYIVDCPSTGTLLGDRFYKIDRLEDINQVIEQHFKDLDYQDIKINNINRARKYNEAYKYPIPETPNDSMLYIEYGNRGGRQKFDFVVTEESADGSILKADLVYNESEVIAKLYFSERNYGIDLESMIEDIEVINGYKWYLFIGLSIMQGFKEGRLPGAGISDKWTIRNREKAKSKNETEDATLDKDVQKVLESAKITVGNKVRTPYMSKGGPIEGECIAVRQDASGNQVCTIKLSNDLKIEVYTDDCKLIPSCNDFITVTVPGIEVVSCYRDIEDSFGNAYASTGVKDQLHRLGILESCRVRENVVADCIVVGTQLKYIGQTYSANGVEQYEFSVSSNSSSDSFILRIARKDYSNLISSINK